MRVTVFSAISMCMCAIAAAGTIPTTSCNRNISTTCDNKSISEADQAQYVPISLSTACGPLACYTVARRMGISVSVLDMVQRCRWQPGTYTTLSTINDVLAALPEVRVSGIKIDVVSLREYLNAGAVVVLPIDVLCANTGHAIVAIAVDDGNIVVAGSSTEAGYASGLATIDAQQLSRRWSGDALVIRRAIASDSWPNVYQWIAVGCCCVGGVGAALAAISLLRRYVGAK